MAMIQLLVGVMIGILVLVAVVLPTVSQVVCDQHWNTGALKTISDLFPLLFMVGAILLVVSIYNTS